MDILASNNSCSRINNHFRLDLFDYKMIEGVGGLLLEAMRVYPPPASSAAFAAVQVLKEFKF